MQVTNAPYILISVGLSAILLGLALPPVGADPLAEGIGVITAVHGQVTVTHRDAAGATPAKLHDDVLFRDIIETQKESRSKALFDDESLLTVGEDSRVEMTEHIYDPRRKRRSMVVKLIHGKLRALVSRIVTGSGSKFEVHTPAAVAAARGTYFVVWVEGETSGVVNIGNSGRVDFTSGGQTISINPGQFSTALPGEVPTQPTAATRNSPVAVSKAIEGTDLKDDPKPERALEVVHAITGDGRGGATGGPLDRSGQAQVGGTTGGGRTAAVTPPAVISGAAGRTVPPRGGGGGR